ncbi:threonine aldolase [Bacteroidia bacterium]|nr:threonine aldolase [Bacteroidia bacterium]
MRINNINLLDSPSLILVEETMLRNIHSMKALVDGDTSDLRPHVKANKTTEVCQAMMKEGITKFKCDTIAEAEMLVQAGARDVLLACQPVGPKIGRLLNLVKAFPGCRFACLVDSIAGAEALNAVFAVAKLELNLYIDVNVGMNWAGVSPSKAGELAKAILSLKNLHLVGVNGYDGHIIDKNMSARTKAADKSFDELDRAYEAAKTWADYPLVRIMGGTVTFPIHLTRKNVECSPGTFLFWDWGNKRLSPNLPFEYAAFLVSRVISVVDKKHICVDLGYKSVASYMPMPRVHFLNLPDAKHIAHSGEHLLLEVADSSKYPLGTVFYGVPEDIAATVALYDKMYVVRNSEIATFWKITARNREI